MSKLLLFSAVMIGASLLQGCATPSALGKVDRNCPSALNEQLDKNGNLVLQNGVTLKCQVKNYTNKMSCVGITDSTNADGLVCDNGKRQAVFLFDENGILKSGKIF